MLFYEFFITSNEDFKIIINKLVYGIQYSDCLYLYWLVGWPACPLPACPEIDLQASVRVK
jgi:hypothetical protein